MQFLIAGHLLKYVIVCMREEKQPSQLINNKTIYDIDRYSELLTDIYNSIIQIL